MKTIAFAFVSLVISVIALADDSPPAPRQARYCATMTWPDGHETKIRNFYENIQFLSACESAPGTCKLDGKPFPPESKDASDPGSKLLADAIVRCVFDPLPEIDTSQPQGKFDSLSGDKSDDKLRLQLTDPSKAPPIFTAQATGKLTAARLKAMDIEFFNEFWVKGEFPTEERVRKIHALAEEGFEVAHLGEMLYNFPRGGFPAFRSDYLIYWNRLKALAKAGNPSAQCLFAHTAAEYRSFNQDPPTKDDEDVLAPYYQKAAAAQGHLYCLDLWVNRASRNDPVTQARISLRCAEAGVSMCQHSMAVVYFEGYGVPKDLGKAMCWIAKAKSQNRALSLENSYRSYRGQIREQIGSDSFSRLVKKLEQDTNCNSVTID